MIALGLRSVAGVMGEKAKRLDWRRGARLSVLAALTLLLGNCSAANKFSGNNSKYSPKVVEDGEPVPKGGGAYKVGAPYRLNGKTYYPSENPAYRAEGIASWYGPDFHGRRTANGEVYDMHGISAAHPTMPIPSYARVTNLENGRSIIVRVNDRGPYAYNRLIDLSIGTAKALDFYGRGLAKVRVEYVGRAPLEGSDDRQLMATLRHDGPAPAPSRVMVAAARPLLPSGDEGRERSPSTAVAGAAPLPPERPYSLGAASTRGAAPPPAKPERGEARSVVRLPDAPDRVPALAAPRSPTPAPAFGLRGDDGAAPVGGNLGLMSGRGLY
jgi:rare lipoprotein A